ncbi:unnamed protein product [Pedinophyceae sp. YPF-701]|nr:unnamed protein product [Pedinophyceae sp. YPF-701]
MDELKNAIAVIPNKYYFGVVHSLDSVQRSSVVARGDLVYCIDHDLLYEPFFGDFGPLNMGLSYRFCERTQNLMEEADRRGKRLYLVAQAAPNFKANATVLVGIYLIMICGWAADEAYEVLKVLRPFASFRDASCGPSTFPLTPQDCLKGMQRARDTGLVRFTPLGDPTAFDILEYEHYEQVEKGDLNWIVPGKLLAFGGPQAKRTEFYGYKTLVPEDYHEYFRRRNVTSVVRLNRRVYDRARFTSAGLQLHEMYFPDGTCPTEAIMQRFLRTVETEPGALAVHCKAGLGRTGVLICAWLCKHLGFTAEEAIAYIRICRPGSVIGPQQHFLKQMQGWLWREGEAFRAQQEQRAASKAQLVRSGSNSLASSAATIRTGVAQPPGSGGTETPRTSSMTVTPRSATPSPSDTLDDGGGAAASDASDCAHVSPMKPLRSGTHAPQYMSHEQIERAGGAKNLRASAPAGSAAAVVKAAKRALANPHGAGSGNPRQNYGAAPMTPRAGARLLGPVRQASGASLNASASSRTASRQGSTTSRVPQTASASVGPSARSATRPASEKAPRHAAPGRSSSTGTAAGMRTPWGVSGVARTTSAVGTTRTASWKAPSSSSSARTDRLRLQGSALMSRPGAGSARAGVPQVQGLASSPRARSGTTVQRVVTKAGQPRKMPAALATQHQKAGEVLLPSQG